MAADPPTDQLDLGELFRAHGTALLKLAVVLTGDRSLAEDLVQDALLRVHRIDQPPAPGTERAYLRRTVINLSHAHDRHLRVVRDRRVAPAGYAPAAEAGAVRRDGQRQVVAAVRNLPDRQRDCVVLRFYEDLTDREIAETLDISPGSVKTHLHRARLSLSTQLEALR